ncbi:MAG: carbohydrate binding domain-containing protein [Spirochaetota bacterium]
MKALRESSLEVFGDSRIVETLDKEWRFFADANNNGGSCFLPEYESTARGWLVLDADRWWQEQGFNGYYGSAWYRKWFMPPTVADGRRLLLAFGAVDGDSVVYLNGKKIGEHILGENGLGWDMPFNFDITSLMLQGKSNLIAVKCTDTVGMSGMFKGVKIIESDGAIVAESIASNMLVNGSFEDVDGKSIPKGWLLYYPGSLAIDDSVKYTGAKSARISASKVDSGKAPCFRQEFPCVPGEKYTVSAYIRTENCLNSAPFLRVAYKSADGKWLSAPNFAGLPTGTSDWKRYRATVTVPNGAATLLVYLFGDYLAAKDATDAAGTVWFDDVQLEKK